MPEVTNIEDLRRGVAELNLQHALGDPYAVDQINEAVESDSFDEAKARIIEVLHGLEAVSLGGFPIGVELDLVEMVGFDYWSDLHDRPAVHRWLFGLVLAHLMNLRIAWLLTGFAWAVRSGLEFAKPDYYEPVTLLDWAAVISYSIAWLLSAGAALLLARDLEARLVRLVAVVFAVAASTAGLANVVEDAFDQSWGGTPYVIGFLVAWIALIPFAGLVWRTKARRMALLPVALFASIALFNMGGGLVALIVASAFAIAPGWFGLRCRSDQRSDHWSDFPGVPGETLRLSTDYDTAIRW
jgi:hypothetical protein